MSRKRKAELHEILVRRDFEGLKTWADSNRNILNTAFSVTFDADLLIRWRAVEALGHLAEWSRRSERIEDFLRRLIWLMNDESGGLGWMAPEALGEILFHVPSMIPAYATILPSYFDEEPFESGARYAVYRAALKQPEAFSACEAKLVKGLAHDEPVRRAYAILALEAMGASGAASAIEPLTGHDRAVTLYDHDTGYLIQKTLGQIATEVLQKLKA